MRTKTPWRKGRSPGRRTASRVPRSRGNKFLFFCTMQRTVSEIARELDAEFDGDGARVIDGVAGLREAEPCDISFLADPKYKAHVERTRAGAVIVDQEFGSDCAAILLRVEDPLQSFTRIALQFAPEPVRLPAGIHDSAAIGGTAVLGRDVCVGANAVIEEGVQIGARTQVWAGCYVGQDVSIGEDCILYPNVSVREHCLIGNRTFIHNGTVIGSDGFGYDVDSQGERTKIAQIGIVEIGNEVEIGSNCTVDRARFGKTRIGNGVKIDNLVMIAHNCVIEDHVVLVAQVGIAGSTIVRHHAVLGGQVGVAGHRTIGEYSGVGAQGGVTKDVPAREYWSGYPAMPHMEAAKLQAGLKGIPRLKERVKQLERTVMELQEKFSNQPLDK